VMFPQTASFLRARLLTLYPAGFYLTARFSEDDYPYDCEYLCHSNTPGADAIPLRADALASQHVNAPLRPTNLSPLGYANSPHGVAVASSRQPHGAHRAISCPARTLTCEI
jgi:hypothetical protein